MTILFPDERPENGALIYIPINPKWRETLLASVSIVSQEDFYDETIDEPDLEDAQIRLELLILKANAMVGEIKSFCSLVAVPSNFLLMDGRTWTQADYPVLFDVVPSNWKSGANFTLPNMVSRTIIGSDTDNPGSFPIQGTEGGEAGHLLTVGEMPSHRHTLASNFYNAAEYVGTGGTHAIGAGAEWVLDAVTSEGGGTVHNNMPPFLVGVFAISAR